MRKGRDHRVNDSWLPLEKYGEMSKDEQTSLL
jgi:hypothetical protein